MNEGFATFAGWLAVDKLFPEWLVFSSFVARDLGYALGQDGMRSSHAVQVEVSSAEEIDQIFDGISYSKGASVIRMLQGFLGDKFRVGVTEYLKRYSFGNATTDCLWACLGEAAGVDVGKLMGQWTLCMGYPCLNVVSERFDKELGVMTLELEQLRFLASGDLKPEEDDVLWTIPITIKTAKGESKHLLKEKKGTVSFETDGSYYKLNQNTTGFYRCSYTGSAMTQLSKALETDINTFSVEDRVGLVSDVFANCRAGQLSTVKALEFLRVFKNEHSFM